MSDAQVGTEHNWNCEPTANTKAPLCNASVMPMTVSLASAHRNTKHPLTRAYIFQAHTNPSDQLQPNCFSSPHDDMMAYLILDQP